MHAEPSTCSCVLCASAGHDTPLERGHCCQRCAQHIDRDLAGIVTDAELAAIGTVSAGHGSRRVYESKPPTNLDALAPYAILVPIAGGERVALWDVLASWERLLREERGLAAYGEATAGHSGTETALQAQAARSAIAVLRAHLAWLVADPTWPLEDFADEVRTCARTLRGLTVERSGERVVPCPTLAEDGSTCGRQLVVRTWLALDDDPSIGEPVACRGCGVVRDAAQLLAAAGVEDAYADAEALAGWFGVNVRTLRKWAHAGKVRRERGLYSWADTRAVVLDKARHGPQDSRSVV